MPDREGNIVSNWNRDIYYFSITMNEQMESLIRLKRIENVLTQVLSIAGKTCPPEQINFVATLFQDHTNGVPAPQSYGTVDGQVSFGFYHLYLKLTKYEADPKIFFQLLEIDRKIGWTNAAHVEEIVFFNKGIKIIEDEKVSGGISIIMIRSIIFFQNWSKWCHFRDTSLSQFASDVAMNYLAESDFYQYGKASKLILASFFKFMLRAEETGKRVADQWIHIQNESGLNVFTGLLFWASRLSAKAVFHLNYI